MSLISILAIVFAFSVLVVIHELGHFLAARWMGVRVEKFSIGFPPKLFSKKIGDTEYSISAIPLGGYVKMSGFIDESMDSEATGADYEYSSKPIWRRMIIITAGVIMNIILAVFIYSILNYSQGETLSPNAPLKIVGTVGVADKIGFQTGDKIIDINDTKIESWNQVHRLFINNIDEGINFQVLRNGALLNLQYKTEWFKEEKGEVLNISPILEARVGETVENMPAEALGLQRNDLIVSLNNIEINNWDDMTEIIRKSYGQEISVKWERDGKLLEGIVIPKEVSIQNEDNSLTPFGQVGIYPYVVTKPVSLLSAVSRGLVQPFEIIYLNIKGFKWMISGIKPVEDSLAGPVMIGKMIGDAAERGWMYYMGLLAALSSILAFFNILPIPALDGGHLFFLIIEGLMGKPLSVKTRMMVQQVGMAVLLSLIVFVIWVDLSRIF